MLLKQKTNKLFYGRWPYKITCRVLGINYFREQLKLPVNRILNDLDKKIFKINQSRRFDEKINVYKITDFINSAKNFIENVDVKKRIEYNKIDLYFVDQNSFDQAKNKLTEWITAITEPHDENDLEKILQDKKFVLCDQLPYKKYKFRIFFKNMPEQIKLNLIQWAEKYGDDIFIPNGMRKKKSNRYFVLQYFYVKDSKMITFVSLAASGYVRRTDEFVVRTDINTGQNREILCHL